MSIEEIQSRHAGFDMGTLKHQIHDLRQAIEIGFGVDYNLGVTIRDISNMLKCYPTSLQCSYSQDQICFWYYSKSSSFPQLIEDVIAKILKRIDQRQAEVNRVSYDLMSGIGYMI